MVMYSHKFSWYTFVTNPLILKHIRKARRVDEVWGVLPNCWIIHFQIRRTSWPNEVPELFKVVTILRDHEISTSYNKMIVRSNICKTCIPIYIIDDLMYSQIIWYIQLTIIVATMILLICVLDNLQYLINENVTWKQVTLNINAK